MSDISQPGGAESRIEVRINGESRAVPAALSLESLVAFLGLDKDRVAIEYNREIVKRARWQSVTIHDGDSLELVQFVGGG